MFFACYLRKSIIDDPATDSPARQRAAIERAVPPQYERRFFEDLDLSGRTEARPDWQRLLAALADPDCAGVACEALDRIYRNSTDFGAFKERLEAVGKQLIIANLPGIDGATPEGDLFLGVVAKVAEFESRVASDRMKRHVYHLQTDQGRHFGPTPFACTRDSKTKHLAPSPAFYWLDRPSRAAWRSDDLPVPAGCEERYFYDSLFTLFSLFAPGQLSLGDVANTLNATGWRYWLPADHATPVLWNRWNVYSVLRRWYLYAGYLLPYEKARTGARPTRPAGHDPIVPVELAEAVGQALAQRHYMKTSALKPPVSHSERRMYILTGIIYCAECGQRLSGQQTGGYCYYRHTHFKGRCNQKAALAPPLESEIVEGLKLLVSQTDLLDDVIGKIRIAYTLAGAENGDLVKLEQKRTEHGRLIDLYTGGLITLPEFGSRRDALAGEIARLEHETASHPTRALADNNLVDLVLSRLAQLEQAEPLTKKMLLHGVFERIEVRGGQVAAVIPQPWAEPLFDLCRLWAGLDSSQHSIQFQIPAWLSVP